METLTGSQAFPVTSRHFKTVLYRDRIFNGYSIAHWLHQLVFPITYGSPQLPSMAICAVKPGPIGTGHDGIQSHECVIFTGTLGGVDFGSTRKSERPHCSNRRGLNNS